MNSTNEPVLIWTLTVWAAGESGSVEVSSWTRLDSRLYVEETTEVFPVQTDDEMMLRIFAGLVF